MTPEQNEQWQKAIKPLDYLDFYAVSKEGLDETRRQLRGWRVPGWAAELRESILSWKEDQNAPWCPQFALRSEAALVGIQILTPSYTDQGTVYQRIFVRFVQEALRPFSEWIMQFDSQRQGAYAPLLILYEECEKFVPPGNINRWKELQSDFNVLGLYQYQQEFEDEIWMVVSLIEETLQRLNPDSHVHWDSFHGNELDIIVYGLNRQHQWRLDGEVAKPGADGGDYMELVANAYLAALESECPPPDWLDEALPPPSTLPRM